MTKSLPWLLVAGLVALNLLLARGACRTANRWADSQMEHERETACKRCDGGVW